MLKALIGTLFAATSLVTVAATPALADTSSARIAFSNNFAGNSWRQAMLKSWEAAATDAVDRKVVAAADAFTTAENQVTEQAAQIQNLILQGYDAIVTEPCAYRVGIDFKGIGEQEVNYLAGKIPAGGNLLEIRGLAGTSIDAAFHESIAAGVARHPRFKIVGSVVGEWNGATAQKAVAQILPSLPEIVGVVDQGGDGYGAAQAFKAAGRPMPTIIWNDRE